MQLFRKISAAIAADKEPVDCQFRAHPLPGAVSGAAARPVAPVRRGIDNTFGTTVFGGADGTGVLFLIESDGTYQVLHSFTDGSDGGEPSAGVIGSGSDSLYGTASVGGTYGLGTVFQYSL